MSYVSHDASELTVAVAPPQWPSLFFTMHFMTFSANFKRKTDAQWLNFLQFGAKKPQPI